MPKSPLGRNTGSMHGLYSGATVGWIGGGYSRLKLDSSTSGDFRLSSSMMEALTCFVAVAVHARIGAPGNSVCRLERARYAGLRHMTQLIGTTIFSISWTHIDLQKRKIWKWEGHGMPEIMAPLRHTVCLINGETQDARCMGLFECIPQLWKGQALRRGVQQLCAGCAAAQL